MSESNDSHRDDPNPSNPDPTVRQSNEQVGSEVGPYRLLELLGEGAMGEVWRAEQREPVKRIVALKLIRKGMDTVEVVTRFEIERQALALMDHPWIANVHDAGETQSGRPLIAMESSGPARRTNGGHCSMGAEHWSCADRINTSLGSI